jgi:Spy/CpxP family protein refolding chaperone
MTRTRFWMLATAVATLVSTSAVFAQTAPPASQQTAAGRAQKPAGRGRAALPPITPNMTPQQLQVHMDAWEMVQAQTVLQLTDDQFPNFVGRLQRLQELRRRQLQEHRRIMQELNGLLYASPAAKPEDINARVKALDDARDTEATDLKKAYLDLDAVLTPWQRGRFRQFEDQVERRKIELLGIITGGRGAATPTPAPTPGRGRR